LDDTTPTLPGCTAGNAVTDAASRSFSAEGASHPGRRRAENEDAYWIDEEIGLAAVADGVSTAHGGGVAAEVCVRAVGSYFAQRGSALRATEGTADCIALLRGSLSAARAEMCAHAEYRGMLGMATTLTVLLRHERHVVIANLGDSRVYRIRDGQMAQVTQDHTLLAESLRRGVCPDPIDRPRLGATITRYMSPRDRVEAQCYAERWQDGDVYLLCSDGLSSYVSDAVILDVFLRSSNLEDAVENMIEAANQAGGWDNVTSVLVRLRQRSATTTDAIEPPPPLRAGEGGAGDA